MWNTHLDLATGSQIGRGLPKKWTQQSAELGICTLGIARKVEDDVVKGVVGQLGIDAMRVNGQDINTLLVFVCGDECAHVALCIVILHRATLVIGRKPPKGNVLRGVIFAWKALWEEGEQAIGGGFKVPPRQRGSRTIMIHQSTLCKRQASEKL